MVTVQELVILLIREGTQLVSSSNGPFQKACIFPGSGLCRLSALLALFKRRNGQGEHFDSQRNSERLDAVNTRGNRKAMRTFSLVSICGSGAKRWTSLSTKQNRRMKWRSETHKRARRRYETERAAVVGLEQMGRLDGGAPGRGGLKGGAKGTGWRASGTGGLSVGYPGLGVEWGLVRVGFASKNARLKLLDRDIGANTQIPGSGLRPRVWANSMGQSTRVVATCWLALGIPDCETGGEDIRFVQNRWGDVLRQGKAAYANGMSELSAREKNDKRNRQELLVIREGGKKLLNWLSA
ncbi:hypothetical protein B0H14DRAFT_2643490 [Mycena olivaceomarginata]|nr:hypothetical protein B0H14DRAFT_2643490 [Mycena olivaceomarginata]